MDRFIHRRTFVQDLLALAATPLCFSRKTVASPAIITRPSLIWSDDFDVLSLSSPNYRGRWRPNEAWQDISAGYRDFASSSWNLNPNQKSFELFSPFTVMDGVLTLTNRVVPENLTPLIRSSMNSSGQTNLPVPTRMGGILITDPNNQSFRYGYFEFRVRFPNLGRGMFPAIWLFRDKPPGQEDGKGRAEIDLFEMFGDPEGLSYHISLHHKNFRGIGETYIVSSPEGEKFGDPNAWHIIALDWKPNSLTFLFDNVVVKKVCGKNASWFDQWMSIRINYAMDAEWFGVNHSDNNTPDYLSMQIDYVRVYMN